ncbi:MAG: hypothetical protein ACI90C_000211 [Rhodoferax sp.]
MAAKLGRVDDALSAAFSKLCKSWRSKWTRASEPFFTTKRFGSSRGLGLSMVYGFAKQSGGSMRIQSAHGGGCRTTFLLPCSRDAVAALSVTLVNVTYRRWIGVSICASLGCGASWS